MLFACCHFFCSAIYTDDSILVRINASHFAGGGGLHTNHQCILIWIWKPTKASDVAMNAGSSPNLMERPKGELMSWWRGHSSGRQITLSPWLNTRFQRHTSLFWKKQTHWCENICPCTVTELMPDSEIQRTQKHTLTPPLHLIKTSCCCKFLHISIWNRDSGALVFITFKLNWNICLNLRQETRAQVIILIIFHFLISCPYVFVCCWARPKYWELITSEDLYYFPGSFFFFIKRRRA